MLRACWILSTMMYSSLRSCMCAVGIKSRKNCGIPTLGAHLANFCEWSVPRRRQCCTCMCMCKRAGSNRPPLSIRRGFDPDLDTMCYSTAPSMWEGLAQEGNVIVQNVLETFHWLGSCASLKYDIIIYSLLGQQDDSCSAGSLDPHFLH